MAERLQTPFFIVSLSSAALTVREQDDVLHDAEALGIELLIAYYKRDCKDIVVDCFVRLTTAAIPRNLRRTKLISQPFYITIMEARVLLFNIGVTHNLVQPALTGCHYGPRCT